MATRISTRAAGSLAFIALLSILSPSYGRDNGRHIALLIGVNKYDNRNLADLAYAERDVQDLNELLKSGYDVHLLLGSSASSSERATKRNIERALDDLFSKGLTKEDTVLIAISGHGEQISVERDGLKHDEPFFCPCDAIPTDSSRLINLSRLIERLGERGGGTNLLLVDACRNDPDPTRGRGIDGDMMLNLPKGMAVFLSCSKGEKAQESAKAGNGHGLFFYFVLEGLKNKDIRNANKELRWDALVAFVKDKMELEASKLLNNGMPLQTPQNIANLGRSPIVLAAGKGLELASSMTRGTDTVVNRTRSRGAALSSANDYITRGNKEYAKKDYIAAMDDYCEALRLDANSFHGYRNRGLVWYQKKDYDNAMADFSKSIRLNPNYSDTYNDRALVWEARNDFISAIEDYNAAIRVDPKSFLAYHNRGRAFLTMKDYDKAVQDFDKAIELDPKSVSVYNDRGRAYDAKHAHQAAIDDYTEAIRLDPQYFHGYRNRGLAWYGKKEYDKAIEDYNEAIRLDPNSAAAYNDRGRAWEGKRQRDKALADYNQAIRVDPQYYHAYNNRGLIRNAKKEYDQAIADYNEALRINPSYATSYNSRGWTWYKKKEFDKAIADFNEAIRLEPSYALAYNNRGIIHYEKRQYTQSLEDYSRAIQYDPQNDMPYNNSALVLVVAQDSGIRNGQKAVEMSLKACELTGWRNPSYIATLASGYAETGDYQSAVKWQQKALTFADYARDYGATAQKRLQYYQQQLANRQR
jgi:tetratricopeptide (TPR) repeat protein